MSTQITTKNFKSLVLESKMPVVIDFWAPWCGPCRMVGPSIDKLSEKYEGKAVVGKLNVDDDSSIAQQYRIMSIPTMMVFKYGEPVETVVGARSYEEIEAMLIRYLD